MNIPDLSGNLKKGWPDPRLMQQIPFGDSLEKLGTDSPFKQHVRNVVDRMNDLLAKAPIEIPADATNPNCHERVRQFVDVWEEIQGDDGIFANSRYGREQLNQFLRICALYHDIGKVIQNDRHPTIGYYYVTLVDHEKQGRNHAKQLEDLLGRRLHKILCDIIRYHDLFGVIGTGEGSLGVLIDALPFYTDDVGELETILSLLVVLNLADIAGTVPLTSAKAGTLAGDWKHLSNVLRECKGHREEFARVLIGSEQTGLAAIERIRRILIARAPEGPGPFRGELDSPMDIEEILRVALGTQFYDFCSDFALVCKLDYALKFIQRLEEYAAKNGKSPRLVMEVVISLITRLVQSYSTFTKRQDGSRRRIGIQVGGWTRTDEISESLIKLMFSDLPRGLNWAAEEATAWYFE